MNKEYKIKLDLNKKLYNKKMAFNQFDENVNDFYIEVTKNNEVVKDLDKSIITLVAIKPNNAVDAQFIEVKEGQIYADLKPSMCDLVGNYQAKAMIVLDGEIVTTDTISYSVNEDKIISKLNDDVVSDERFTLFTDALARLSDIESSEEQRVINEAERILSEENRKIEEAKRVEAETNRVNEEAKRRTTEQARILAENARVGNENTREASEVTRQTNETQRIEAETQRQNRYNSFILDAEANANNFENYTNTAKVKEEERKSNELDRKSQETKRISNEVERISNENTRKANEVTRIESEKQRVDAENLRKEKIIEIQSDYDSLKKVIIDENASANLQNQINQTNSQLEQKANVNDLEVERKRIDQFTKLNEGSTTGDAELIDGRIGVDGVVYSNIGEAIRGQVTNGYNIAKSLPVTDDITDEIKDGIYHSYLSNLSTYSSLESVYTGYVHNVIPGNSYIVNVFNPSSDYKTNSCNFYDENGALIPHNSDFYNYKLVDEESRIVEFKAPTNAYTMSYTNYIADKSSSSCRVRSSKMAINWLDVKEENLNTKLLEDLKNPLNLNTSNVINELECTLDEGYFLSADRIKVSNDNYNTLYCNVENKTSLRATVFSTNLVDDGSVLYFWTANNKLIPVNTYEYTVYDVENKIIDIKVPSNAVECTITCIKESDNWGVKELGGKVSLPWLKITDDMLSQDMRDYNNAFKLTTTDKISNNIIYNYEWGYFLGTDGYQISNNGMGTAYFNVIQDNRYRMRVYQTSGIDGDLSIVYFWDKNGYRIEPTLYEYEVVDNELDIIDIIAPKGAIRGTITYKESQDYWWVKQVGGRFAPNWLTISKNNLDTELNKTIFNTEIPLKYGHCLDKPFDFKDKSVVFFGDSITAGVTSPSLAITSNSYAKLFAEKFNMSYESQAASGSFICDTADTSISNKVLAYNKKKDFIFIAGGTNDWAFGKSVGEYGDTTIDTFYGALHIMCESLKNNHSESTIIFITPINQNVARPDAITTMNEYRNAIFEVATTYGFNVVDGSKISFPNEQGSFADAVCSDGVHPSELGHQLYAKSLCGILC